jgi:hypothetical protein
LCINIEDSLFYRFESLVQKADISGQIISLFDKMFEIEYLDKAFEGCYTAAQEQETKLLDEIEQELADLDAVVHRLLAWYLLMPAYFSSLDTSDCGFGRCEM